MDLTLSLRSIYDAYYFHWTPYSKRKEISLEGLKIPEGESFIEFHYSKFAAWDEMSTIEGSLWDCYYTTQPVVETQKHVRIYSSVPRELLMVRGPYAAARVQYSVVPSLGALNKFTASRVYGSL